MSSTENDPKNEDLNGSDSKSDSEGTAAGTVAAPTGGKNGEENLAMLGGVEIVYKPLEPNEIPPTILANLNPQADEKRRLALARNIVPLPPRDMALTLFCLMNDPKAPIREAAEDSFDDLPPNILKTIAGQDLPGKILDYIARNFYDDDDPQGVIESLVLNAATDAGTLMMMARVASPRILDVIANNQVRLQREPQIVFEFPKNPRVSIALVSRVLEFARRQRLITIEEENEIIDRFVGKLQPEAEPVKVEKIVKEVVREDGEIDWEFPSFLTNEFEADLGLDAEAADIEGKIQAKMNMRDLVRELTVPQKLRMAARGNMEARKILIEDPLALVAKEVLKSPRITKTEIERAAESRTIDPEVIEEIAKDASMTRSYQVRMALVCNPKTPLRIANRMMGTLLEKDIKNISKSKAVPMAVASIARQRIDAQEQRRKKRDKKKKK